MKIVEKHVIEITHETHPEDNTTLTLGVCDWSESVREAIDDGVFDIHDLDAIVELIQEQT